MKKTAIVLVFSFTVLSGVVISCKKETECFDAELYQKHKDDICLQDCPGVVGCDGKTYCNECIARTKGIRVK
jgi:hypothetical protein